MKTNTMNSDQTASKGAVLSRFIVFAVKTSKEYKQGRELTRIVWNGGQRATFDLK